MTRYYTNHLSAHRLQAVYDCAPPETIAYLEAEIAFVLERVGPGATVLELGCGYGRVLKRLLAVVSGLAPKACDLTPNDEVRVSGLRFAKDLTQPTKLPQAGLVTGIDNSPANIAYAMEYLGADDRVRLAVMDAAALGFRDKLFDLTICIQNGICAFRVDPLLLMKEAMRVTRPGGQVLFSSYAKRFWPHRLAWFEIQSAHGLLGSIDYSATGDGVIACTDGFRSGTMTEQGFHDLAERLGVEARITEVAASSLFCEIVISEPPLSPAPKGADNNRNQAP